jgi:hypothetical protein
LSSSAIGLRGSVFGIFEEQLLGALELSFLRRRKKEERSKHPIENLSETLSQNRKNLVRDEPLGTNAMLRH